MIEYLLDDQLRRLSTQVAITRGHLDLHIAHCAVCRRLGFYVVGRCRRRAQLEREMAAANGLVTDRLRTLRDT